MSSSSTTASSSSASAVAVPLPPMLPKTTDSFSSASTVDSQASDSNPTDLYDPDAPLDADDVFAARMCYSAAIHAYTSRQWETTRQSIEKASAEPSSPTGASAVAAAR
ncbi:hypothetical protein RQP46_001925 [Phenoliferia psychrophenolica]